MTDEPGWEQQQWLEEYQQWIESMEGQHGSVAESLRQLQEREYASDGKSNRR